MSKMPRLKNRRDSPVTVSASPSQSSSSRASATSSTASSPSPSPTPLPPPNSEAAAAGEPESECPPTCGFSDDSAFELPADAAQITPDPTSFLSRLGIDSASGDADSRVTVLAVFGKSGRIGGAADKARIARETTQKDVFGAKDRDSDRSNPSSSSASLSPWISCYHDARSNRVFLHFVNQFTDASELLRQWESARAEMESSSFLSVFSSRAFDFARALLFIFHAAHLVVLYHPNHAFDLAYLRLFKAIDAFRTKLQPVLSEVLSESTEVPFPREWIQQGRQTPPRLMVYFGTSPKGLRGSKGTKDHVKRDGKLAKHPPVRKLEFSLEDQIFRILKRARIVNVGPNSLFHLPTREGFVHVETGSDTSHGDSTLDALNDLYNMLENPRQSTEMSGPFLPYFQDQKRIEDESRSCAVKTGAPLRSFSRFLSSHLESIPARGTDAEGKAKLELPKAALWYKYVSLVLPYFFPNAASSDSFADASLSRKESVKRAQNLLSSHTSLELRFSEARCLRALPMAFAAYKEGLQPHYLEGYHNAKLMAAMSLYSVQARGPSSSKYAEALAEECAAYWKSGRQQCEELSLTGNHCGNRRHRVANAIEKTTTKVLPTMPHNSSATTTTVAACNCGRVQANREDPFTLEEANLKFYSEMESECCQTLERLPFPVHTESALAATVLGPTSLAASNSDQQQPVVIEAGESDSDDDLGKAMEGLGLDSKAKANKAKTASKDHKQTLADLAASSSTSTNTFGINRQESSGSSSAVTTGANPAAVAAVATSSPLPISHMPTAETPPSRLPLFSSWSLVQLGSSFVYHHSAGVSQPGFLSNSRSLLAWEVPLKNASLGSLAERWPNLAEAALKKQQSSDVLDKSGLVKISVEVFLGMEYECQRGHRFLSSAPDRVMKQGGNPNRETNAAKVLNADMPLYMTCPCRNVAQLIRVHVVTPKAPLHVTLCPRVQPCPDGPVFHPGGAAGPVRLPPNTCWILRLPYIYWGENGAHLPPKEPPAEKYYGRLMKGLFGFSEDLEGGGGGGGAQQKR